MTRSSSSQGFSLPTSICLLCDPSSRGHFHQLHPSLLWSKPSEKKTLARQALSLFSFLISLNSVQSHILIIAFIHIFLYIEPNFHSHHIHSGDSERRSPQLPCRGQIDVRVAANLWQTAPPTTTQHPIAVIRGKVGKVFCPRTQRHLNRQPFGCWTTRFTIWASVAMSLKSKHLVTSDVS